MNSFKFKRAYVLSIAMSRKKATSIVSVGRKWNRMKMYNETHQIETFFRLRFNDGKTFSDFVESFSGINWNVLKPRDKGSRRSIKKWNDSNRLPGGLLPHGRTFHAAFHKSILIFRSRIFQMLTQKVARSWNIDNRRQANGGWDRRQVY